AEVKEKRAHGTDASKDASKGKNTTQSKAEGGKVKNTIADLKNLPRTGNHPVLGKLNVCYGTSASCVTYKDEGGKPRLLVQVGSSMCAKHAEMLAKLLQHACRSGCSKEELVSHRGTLLAK
ncbi:unnamed protein product, partial [Prorocentrum cordatum]